MDTDKLEQKRALGSSAALTSLRWKGSYVQIVMVTMEEIPHTYGIILQLYRILQFKGANTKYIHPLSGEERDRPSPSETKTHRRGSRRGNH